MDEDILRTVEKISGKLSRDCYYDLCCLVKAAIPRMPGTFSMETLYPEAQRYSEKEKDTLAKALSRAAEDIWDCGDRAELQKLFQRVLREKPTPKDLVRVLALSIWRRRKAVRPQVRYQVLETRHPRRFGFSGESWEPERHLVVLLPGREQAEVEQLVRRLNQRQIPIQEAEERFLNGEDLLPVLWNRGGASRRRLLLCFAPGVLQELLHLGGVGFLGVQQPLREISDLTVSTGVVPRCPGYFWWPPWCFPE